MKVLAENKPTGCDVFANALSVGACEKLNTSPLPTSSDGV